ncbi:MAG: ribosomal protein S18-alanine N-acetyltransferase [Desulfobaccales bacterium]
MTPPLLIRRASLTDVWAICEIEKLSFPSPWSRWCFLAEYLNTHSTILVAGPRRPQPWEVWGYIVFWVVVNEMHILNLAVHPAHRRRGIARALLTAALAEGRQRGATMVSLEVRPSNAAALALYQAFGFQEVGLRPRYYNDNDEDALVYGLFWDEA